MLRATEKICRSDASDTASSASCSFVHPTLVLLTEPGADLKKEPSVDTKHLPLPDNQLTLGDLHGNTLKLLHFLVRQHVLQLLPGDYEKLAAIYLKGEETTASDITQFKKILAQSSVNSSAGFIRLIGDDLADRGKNDYLTLLVLELLANKNVPFEILLSNHSYEFLRVYETTNGTNFKIDIINPAASSANIMQYLINKKQIDAGDVSRILSTIYIPRLKLMSYTLNEDLSNITLYNHAIANLDTLQSIALKLRVPYADKTCLELTKSIDKMNAAFSRHAAAKTLSTLITIPQLIQFGVNDRLTVENSICFAIWNRNETSQPCIHPEGKYKINYVHGHTQAPQTAHTFCLDSNFGKGDEFYQGDFLALFSREKTLSLDHSSCAMKKRAAPIWASSAFFEECKTPLQSKKEEFDMNRNATQNFEHYTKEGERFIEERKYREASYHFKTAMHFLQMLEHYFKMDIKIKMHDLNLKITLAEKLCLDPTSRAAGYSIR